MPTIQPHSNGKLTKHLFMKIYQGDKQKRILRKESSNASNDASSTTGQLHLSYISQGLYTSILFSLCIAVTLNAKPEASNK